MALLDTPLISVLIPARSSSHCLQPTVETLVSHLKPRYNQFEILIVCNRAPSEADDGTETLAEALAQAHPEVRKVIHTGPPGKGIALKTGFQHSKGEWVFFTDSDLPYDLAFFDAASKWLLHGMDFVSGNRRLYESTVECPIPLLRFVNKRHRLGMRFNSLIRFFLKIHSTDTQCGIKAMTRRFALQAFQKQTCPGFLFDLEMFLVRQESRFRGTELPVRYRIEEQKSTVQITKEAFQVFRWIPQIFFQKKRGHYRAPIQPLHCRSIYQAIFRNRWKTDPGTQFFLLLRWFFTPFEHILSFLPRKGVILDLGCGHGLSTLASALENPDRTLFGIDHDEIRIEAARKSAVGIQNITFQVQDIRETLPSADGILIVDSIHYFTPAEQERLLKNVFTALKPGGVFVMRAMDPSLGWISKVNQAYEWLAMKSGFTRTQIVQDTPRAPEAWRALLSEVGFSVISERCSSVLFADVLYVCRRKQDEKTAQIPLSHPLITADDWGMTPAINEGILHLARAGVVGRVSMMVDAKFLTHGLDQLKSIPHIEMGLHLDFTSQAVGNRTPRFQTPWSFLVYLLNPFIPRSQKHHLVESEVERQLSLAEAHGVRISYLDSHHHVHLFPRMIGWVGRSLRKRGIKQIRLPYDPSLWLSRKFPLCLLGVFARRNIILHGFAYAPCFYPQKKHFRSSGILKKALDRKWDFEVIVHPALRDDFESAGVKDSYRAERIKEFQRLCFVQ